MDGVSQGPRVQYPNVPVTLANLAALNKHGDVTKVLKMLIADGELADYDDELANRVKDAIEIVDSVCLLALSQVVYDKP